MDRTIHSSARERSRRADMSAERRSITGAALAGAARFADHPALERLDRLLELARARAGN